MADFGDYPIERELMQTVYGTRWMADIVRNFIKYKTGQFYTCHELMYQLWIN